MKLIKNVVLCSVARRIPTVHIDVNSCDSQLNVVCCTSHWPVEGNERYMGATSVLCLLTHKAPSRSDVNQRGAQAIRELCDFLNRLRTTKGVELWP